MGAGVPRGGRLLVMSRLMLARHLTHGNAGSQPPTQLYMSESVLVQSRRSRRRFLVTIRIMKACFWLTIWAVTLFSLPAVDAQARTGGTYKVQGTVIAITLTQTPPLIVVKTALGPKNFMTVGAAVTAKTKIVRGKKRIALNTIREGEVVWLTYVKAPGGVLAEIIRVAA